MATSSTVWQNIKDHPIFIVLGFCAVTAGGTATVYEKFVLPYQTKVLESQVSDLQKTISSYPDTKKLLVEKDSTIKRLLAELDVLRQKNLVLSGENVFSIEDPYPKSFRTIRIGDPVSKIQKYYAGKIEKSEDYDYLSVKVSDFFFSSATYYPESAGANARVRGILFHLNYTNDQDTKTGLDSSMNVVSMEEGRKRFFYALENQLIERYGEGKVVKRSRFWTVKGVTIELNSRDYTLFLK